VTEAVPNRRERRFLEESREWIVRERDSVDALSRPWRCLVFMSDAAVRRVWLYPERWYDLEDAELLELMQSPVRWPVIDRPSKGDAGSDTSSEIDRAT